MRQFATPPTTRLRRLAARVGAILGAGLFLSACTTFAPTENRVGEINKNASDYTAQATLLNLARAKLDEPLTFVSITGLDGTNSISGTAGFGGFALGPHLHTAPRSFLLGPDSLTRSGSNTFHVSVVDDPASFVALLSPVTPATIGFFNNQGYPRELLFFLFVDRVREIVPGAGTAPAKVTDYVNDPTEALASADHPHPFGEFQGLLGSLLDAGLSAQLDVTALPTGRALPKSKLCFDPMAPRPNFHGTKALKISEAASCDGVDWLETVAAAGAGGGSSAGGPTLVPAPDGSAWLTLPGQDKVAHVTVTGLVATFDLPKAKEKPKQLPLTAFPLIDSDGIKYQVYTRSVYGVYAYLGALLQANHGRGTDIDNLLKADGSGYGGMLHITSDKAGCFTEVDYRGTHYCIPQGASNTKRVFALLHQLQELNTAPSNAPTTLTVTNVP